MALRLARYIALDKRGRREYDLEVIGSKIKFVYEALSSTLLITSTHSADLSAPYAENWLGEPLRILFGQLIYPRLVARNSGDGRAMISIRRSPSLVRGAGWAALWAKETPNDDTDFWNAYARILEFVARDDKGQVNFDANALTRLYEECIQAARGTRWLWALTFASTIEGLAKLLRRKDAALDELAKPSPDETKAIENLASHIGTWGGADDLKRIATNAIRRSGQISTIRVLRRLVAAGVASDEQVAAWEAIRPRVMHGNLISIYSTKEEDSRLLALSALMHAMTRYLIETKH